MISVNIHTAVDLLRNGEVVAIPTETVYGLAANAFNPIAVAQIFTVKERPFFDPLIVHTNSIQKIEQWVQAIPEKALQLAQHFWPGPLTLVLKKRAAIPDIVTAGNDTVAVRIPNHPLTLNLLSHLDFPLAAPSANPFGYISPTTAQHVDDQLGRKIPYILDGGPCSVGLESTIVSFAEKEPVLLRLGGIPVEKIAEAIGDIKLHLSQHSSPQAPGQMDSHYAPHAKLFWGNIEKNKYRVNSPQNTGAITLSKVIEWLPEENQIQLSKNENLFEAAGNIFSAMRILDNKRLEVILAEPMPEEGLGRAINDRLRRAAHNKN